MDGNLAMAEVLELNHEPPDSVIYLLRLRNDVCQKKKEHSEKYKKYEKEKDNPKIRVMQMFEFGKFQALGNVIKVIDEYIDNINSL